MSDSDEDDKFLSGLQGANRSYFKDMKKKAQLFKEFRKKEHIKNLKLKEQEYLQAALAKPLPKENMGFKLLAKMGYKPGQSLGKPGVNEDSFNKSRLTEPIGITIKSDRQGLGREAALQELKEMRYKLRQQRLNKELGGETSIEDFRRRTNQKHEEKFVSNALRRCQVTCENLDIKNNVTQPELPWFWPDRTKETIEDITSNEDEKEELVEEEIEEFSCQEKLEMLTNYVRTSYLFCYWCGVQYTDANDMSDNCPGLTKDDH